MDPSFGPELQQAFAQSESGWKLASAQVHRQRASGRACRADGVCIDFVLGPQSERCAGTAVPAGCLRLTPESPALLAVFKELKSPWQRAAEVAPQPSPPHLWRWAVAWFVVPLACGMALGTVLRRWRSWLAVALGALGWLGLGVWLSLGAARLGLWDGLGVGGMAALGWGAVLRPGQQQLRRSGLALASTAAALILAEIALDSSQIRWPVVQTANRPPWFPAGELETLLRTKEPGYCQLWGPPLGTADGCHAAPLPAHSSPSVLHVGDSMLASLTLPESVSIPAQLRALLPPSSHVNTGMGATSLDVQSVVAGRFLANRQWSALILHIYPCNDLQELDEPHAYCGDKSILVEAGGVFQWRCPVPSASAASWTAQLRLSPPPFPFHLWAAKRALARAGVALAADVSWRLRPSGITDEAEAVERYGQLLHQLHRDVNQHGAKLGVVMMPIRASACAPRNRRDREALLRLVRAQNVPLWDAQPLADAAVQAGGESSFFLEDPPRDPHLNPNGLTTIARWLAPQLRAWLMQDAPQPNRLN